VERVAGFNSAVEAHAAAAFLMESGVAATVTGHLDAFGGLGTKGFARGYGVFVDRAQLEQAKELIGVFRSEKARPEAGWEHFTVPDLSKLAGRVEAPCPSCGRGLPLDPMLSECPACGAEADVGEALVARYGPEILAECYTEETELSDEELKASAVSCGCGYNLAGLGGTGVCPECGRAYSKHELIRRGLM
jgi:rubrerythrin